MQPEGYVQKEVCDGLKRAGWIIIRAGFDGYPDVIALHPSGYGKGWLPGKKKKGFWYIKWKNTVPLCPSGLNLSRELPGTKLFIEFKKEGGGQANGRQDAYLSMLNLYGEAMKIDNPSILSILLERYPHSRKS